MKDKYFFMHIPKTAGTSLVFMFNDLLGTENVKYIVDNEYQLQAEEVKQYKLVGGHLLYSTLSPFKKNRYSIIFLRNPVDRFISQYYYFKMHGVCEIAKNNDINQYIEALKKDTYSGNVNVYIWYLTAGLKKAYSMGQYLRMAKENLAKMDFIGICEFFSDSLDLLCRDCGWPPVQEIPVLNIAIGSLKDTEVDDKIISRIKELNKYDLELYDYGLKLFNKKKRSILYASNMRSS